MDSKLPRDQHAWNAFLFILFPIAVLACFWLLQSWKSDRALWTLGTFDIVILALATFRLTRLVVSDKIFSFFRIAFTDTLQDGTEIKPPRGFRRAIAELTECIWCTGIWAVLPITVLYVSAPAGRFFVMLLAIASLGGFMQVIARRVGAGQNNHAPAPHVCS